MPPATECSARIPPTASSRSRRNSTSPQALATAAAEVVNVFSDQHSYIPAGGTFEYLISRRSSPMSISAPANAASE